MRKIRAKQMTVCLQDVDLCHFIHFQHSGNKRKSLHEKSYQNSKYTGAGCNKCVVAYSGAKFKDGNKHLFTDALVLLEMISNC